jgi:hypothetical protein
VTESFHEAEFSTDTLDCKRFLFNNLFSKFILSLSHHLFPTASNTGVGLYPSRFPRILLQDCKYPKIHHKQIRRVQDAPDNISVCVLGRWDPWKYWCYSQLFFYLSGSLRVLPLDAWNRENMIIECYLIEDRGGKYDTIFKNRLLGKLTRFNN